MQSCDSLPVKERVQIGKKGQNEVVACLNVYHGFDIVEGTFQEDTREKIDVDITWPDGRVEKGQVKVRESGRDLIVAYRDPFMNSKAPAYMLPEHLDESHPSTVIGRDVFGKYKWYICRSPEKKWIWFVDGHRLKEIVEAVILEWRESGQKVYKGNPFTSTMYKSVQVRYHIDAKGGWPKILVFVPPAVLKDPDEIRKFEYKPV